MHSDAEVLAVLSARLSEEALPHSLQRILRVEAAWQQLHDPDLLAAFQASELPPLLTASHIASLALGGDLRSPLDASRITASDSEAAQNSGALADAAVKGLELVREHRGLALAQHVMEDPGAWRDPLTLAWPAIQQREAVLSGLLSSEIKHHRSLAVHLVQANLELEAASTELANACGEGCASLLAHLLDCGDTDLARQFALVMPESNTSAGTHGVGSLLFEAEKLQLEDEPTAAYRSLQSAWDRAASQLSAVADRLANFARLEGDPVLTVEAAQKAFETEPNPERRARYALSLLAVGRAHEGHTSLPAETGSIEEEISRGILLQAGGRNEEARAALKRSVGMLTTGATCNATWHEHLMTALRELDLVADALSASQARVQATPWNSEARRACAEMLEYAGDPQAAIDQARLALALAPKSAAAKRTLAKSLTGAGVHEESLPWMEQLSALGEIHIRELADHALVAGDRELADRICKKALEKEPFSADAQTLDARRTCMLGQPEKAVARLTEIVRREAQHVPARLALAEAQLASGDEVAAGETLYAAAQAIPHRAEPKLALAQWLRSQHRLSEAAEMARSAADLDPGNPECLLEHAELELEVGQSAKAVEAFTRAHARQPASWRTRLGLARALESVGDLTSAFELAKTLPPAASFEALLHAGRIVIRAAESAHLEEGLVIGSAYLDRAAEVSPEDPRITLWQGRAYEVAGESAEAMKSYQSCLPKFSSDDADSYQAALLGLSRSAMAAGNVSLALSTLEQSRARFPTSLEVLSLLSDAYLRANLPERAVEVAEEGILQNPHRADGYIAKARAEAAVGDLASSVETCSRLAQVAPHETQVWRDVAGIAQANDQTAIARKAIAEALWRSRREPTALARAAELLERLDEDRGASLALRAACRQRPDDGGIHRLLGELSDRIGDADTAYEAWSRAAELEPEHAKSLEGAANAHWRLGNAAPALEMWQRALELKPDDPALLRSLARGHMKLGDIQSGLNMYASAMDGDPYDAALALEAGKAALRHGAEPEALPILEAAVELDSSSPEAWAALGECYVMGARWSEAEMALAQASASSPALPRVASLRTLIAQELGDKAGAAEWFDQSARMEPQNAGDAIWLSRAAMRMGDWDLALAALDAWLNGNQEIEAQLERLSGKITLAEAHWLYRACGAQSAAPPEAAASMDSYRSILHALEHQFATEDGVKGLRMRAGAAFTDLDARELSQLEGYALQHADGWAAQALALAQLRAGSHQAAIEALMIAALPPYAAKWDHLIRTLAYRQQDEREAALAELELAAQDPALRPMAEAMTAELLLDDRDHEGAIECLNRALAASPAEAHWHHRLAQLYLQQNEPDAALPHLQQAVELDPHKADYRLMLARSLQSCGHSEEAFRTFEEILQGAEVTGEDFLAAAEVAMQAGNHERALEWFERACTLLPSNPTCLIGAARAASALGDRRLAEERMDAALRLSPSDPAVYTGQGEILASMGDLKGALAAFDRAATWGSGGAELHRARSKALFELGHKEQALQELHRALEKAPEQASLWFELAQASVEAGDFEAAEDAAGKAVRFAPMSADYRLALARISRHRGNLDRALDELLRAAELNPASLDLALEQGLVHEARREYPQALKAYERAIDLDEACMKAYYRSGVVLRTLKAYREAGQMLKRAAELAPIDREVLHQLAAVRALELVHGGAVQQGATA